jgi:phage gp46-like protein
MMSYDISIASPPAPGRPAAFWSTFWGQSGLDGEPLGDWRVTPLAASENAGGLEASDAFGSSVILSLFTDRRAPEGWRPEITDRRGWWGDLVAPANESPRETGSHLWLLENEIVSADTINLARIFTEEALAWMTETEAAARIAVETGAIENPRRGIWINIDIFARDGSRLFARRFERFWNEAA